MGSTVHVVSLGCPKARVDAEVMVGLLQEEGLELVEDPAQAEIIAVNTCGFLQAATRESIETIIDMGRYKAEGRCRRLIVTGCLVQRYAAELGPELPEVDTFLGTTETPRIVAAARGELPERTYMRPGSFLYDETSPRTNTIHGGTAYIKIAEGCSRSCTFCIIPRIRGRQRSRPIESIVAEARRLAAAGVGEIILVAQDTTSYGIDLGLGRGALADLLEALEGIDGLRWIRLQYLYPWNVNDRIIEAMARPGPVLPYVDMPLQHIDDGVLKGMRRHVLRSQQEELIETLRRRLPDLTLRTTLITGFPGETEAAFRRLVDWVEQVEFDRLGVFPYSPEEGTVAYAMEGQVPAAVAQARADEIMARQQAIARRKNEALIDRRLEVVVDGVSDEHEAVWVGRHAGQAPEIDGQVYLDFQALPEPMRPGEFISVRIADATPYDLSGVVLPAD